MDFLVAESFDPEVAHLHPDYAWKGPWPSPPGQLASGDVIEQVVVEIHEPGCLRPAHRRDRIEDRAKSVDEGDREGIEAVLVCRLAYDVPQEIVDRQHRVDLLLDEVRPLGTKDRGALAGSPRGLMSLDRIVGQLNFPPHVIFLHDFLGRDRRRH